MSRRALGGNHEHGRGTAVRLEPHFLDPRQQRVHALVERTGEHGVGHDDVQTLEAWNPGQQIPVSGMQAMRIERLSRSP